MKKNYHYLIILLLPTLSFGQNQTVNPAIETYIQEAQKAREAINFRQIRLSEIVEEGLRKNFDQRIRGHQKQIFELEWEGKFRKFWFPEVTLQLTTDSQRAGILYDGKKDNGKLDRIPDGSLALSFGNYTIFNWGKDYLDYLNQRTTYNRRMESLRLDKRKLMHQLMIEFFRVMTIKEYEKIAKVQLRHASFIYRFNREKAQLGKVSKQAYYQARSEYLRAQNEYFEAKKNAEVADEQLSGLISHEPGTRYLFSERIKFIRLNTPFEDVIKYAEDKNSDVLIARKDQKIAKRTYRIAKKDNLPLPKFTVDLGAYAYNFDRNRNSAFYANDAGHSDIEIVATINATWTLFGEDGLFNRRVLGTSYLQKEISARRVQNAQLQSATTASALFGQVQVLENQIKILEARKNTNRKTFDTVMANYMKKNTRFVDFKLALEEFTQSEMQYYTALFEHAKSKILLAQAMGMDHFIGENFERLAENIDGEK